MPLNTGRMASCGFLQPRHTPKALDSESNGPIHRSRCIRTIPQPPQNEKLLLCGDPNKIWKRKARGLWIENVVKAQKYQGYIPQIMEAVLLMLLLLLLTYTSHFLFPYVLVTIIWILMYQYQYKQQQCYGKSPSLIEGLLTPLLAH